MDQSTTFLILSSSVEGVVVDQLLIRFSICRPFRRYSQSKSKVVRIHGEFWTIFCHPNFLGADLPKIARTISRHKNIQNLGQFWTTSDLIANISGTDPHIENRKSSLSTTTPPTLGEKKLLYFGP